MRRTTSRPTSRGRPRTPATTAARRRSSLLLHERRLDEARGELDRATKLRPDDASAWYNLGLCHAAAGHDTDAVFPLMQAVSLDPTRAAARYNLGFALWRAGRKEEARMHLEIAGGQNPALRRSVDRLLGKTPPPPALLASPPRPRAP